jgi:hypothetical protein
VTGLRSRQEARFLLARFFSLVRLSRASSFSKSALDTFKTILSALLSRSAGVSPGTFGAGFITPHREGGVTFLIERKCT